MRTFLLQNYALWDIFPMYCGISEMGLLELVPSDPSRSVLSVYIRLSNYASPSVCLSVCFTHCSVYPLTHKEVMLYHSHDIFIPQLETVGFQCRAANFMLVIDNNDNNNDSKYRIE